MRRLVLPLTIVTVAVVAVASRPAPEETISVSSLNGAWKTVQVHADLSDTTWTRSEDRPNILLFTDGHWAAIRIAGDGKRTDLPEEPTDEQLLEAWRPLRASAGTYSVSGSKMTSTVLIAKNPNPMNEQRAATSEFKLDGNKLVRTFRNEENGNTWTVTYERVE